MREKGREGGGGEIEIGIKIRRESEHDDRKTAISIITDLLYAPGCTP